jgi:hypothetical protein
MPKQRGTSRFQGVYYGEVQHRWIARIYFAGKTKHIGCYRDEEDAAHAYNLEAVKCYGENAVLNVFD